MNARVYVDGFNLYYGSLTGTPYSWLDLRALCELALPKYLTLGTIKYFTARVSSTRHDPTQRNRQDSYLRALEAQADMEIIFGHFLKGEKTLPLVNGHGTARVTTMEEKGSDVNIATHLLCDAFRGEIEAAAVITNDSDLVAPIEVVRAELGVPVIVLAPISNQGRRASQQLNKAATQFRSIRKGALARAQFPTTIHDRRGTFSKPPAW